jgi:superfamily II DNA helicase RecQ
MIRQASPYLTVVEASVATMAPGASRDWKGAVAAERKRLAGLRAATERDRRGPGANADPAVLADLVEWRRTLARASGVPAYVICHDATLAALAEAKPQDRQSLLAVPGLGPVKVERWGESLLELVGRGRG